MAGDKPSLSSWYKIKDWIECSIERDAAFCCVCRHFAPPSHGNVESVFISTGFRNLKKANGKDGKFSKHKNCQCHKISTSASFDHDQNLFENTSVRKMVNLNYLEYLRHNRHYIRTIGEIILLTVSQI